MEAIGSFCCFPIPKNSNNGVRRWVRSMALVSLPPENCSPSVPLRSFSYWLSWRVLSLLCCCQQVAQSVLGHWLPGAALSAACEKAASLQQGSVLSGGRMGLCFEKWCLSSCPQYSWVAPSCMEAVEEHAGKLCHLVLRFELDMWLLGVLHSVPLTSQRVSEIPLIEQSRKGINLFWVKL